LATGNASQQASAERQEALHDGYMKRLAQDQEKYSQQQLGEAEQLYLVGNRKWGTPEAIASLKTVVQKYPGINFTGEAELNLAQMSQGDERDQYLQDCINNYNDCFYDDGVLVGAYARFLLAQDYQSQGEIEKAKALFNEIKTNYADAVDHGGNLLVDSFGEGYIGQQTKSAELEFRLVAAEGDTNTPADELADPNDRTGQTKLRILKEVLLDSSAVASASLESGQAEDKTISVILKSDAARKFLDITAANIGRRLAIVWRGRVLKAPMIREKITDPAIEVTGKMSDAECQVLLDLLNFKSKPPATGQVLPVSSTPDVILTTNGLISWWPAEGNAGDIIGTNDGTLCGGAGFTNGIVGQAFDFRGKAQKVIIPDNESLKLTNSLTIECWIYVRGPGFILFRGDNRPGLDPYALQVNPGGSLAFAIYSEANEAATVYGRIPLKQWIHAAATLNGSSGNMRLYVDGVLVAEKSTIIRPLRDLDPQADPGLAIGGHAGSADYSPFDGMVDELSLYSRALGEDEIRAIANAGKTGKRKVMASFDEAAINSAINNAQERSQKPPAPAAGVDKAAISSAEAWLNAIDAGRYSESWKGAAPFFQGAVTEKGWTKSMESFRKPLGGLISRKLKSARPMTELPGAPDGQYVVMKFETSFANKKTAVETVTFMLEKDGQWRAAGYFIN
jgi:hypothetical protein